MDGLVFSSEAQVKEVVMRECPTGDAFEVFLDVMSLFCCDPSYSPATGWEKWSLLVSLYELGTCESRFTVTAP